MSRFHLLLSLSLFSVAALPTWALERPPVGPRLDRQSPEQIIKTLFAVKKVTTEQAYREKFIALTRRELEKVLPSESPQDREALLAFITDPERYETSEIPAAKGKAGEMLTAWRQLKTKPALLRNLLKSYPEANYLVMLKEFQRTAELPGFTKEPDGSLLKAFTAVARSGKDDPVVAQVLLRQVIYSRVAMPAEVDLDTNINPWLRHMLAGRRYLKIAWDGRGNSYADEVTPEGWRIFETNLALARKELTAAWDLNSETPEAAAAMVEISSLDQSAKIERLVWLKRAVEAQVDFLPAFERYLWFIRPHWGGDIKMNTALIASCLEAGIPDSLLPLVAADAALNLLRDLPLVGCWGFFGAAQLADPLLLELKQLEGNSKVWVPNRQYLPYLQATICFFAGRNAESAAILAKIPPRNYPSRTEYYYSHVPIFFFVDLISLQPVLSKKADLAEFNESLARKKYTEAKTVLGNWIRQTADPAERQALLTLYGSLYAGLPADKLVPTLPILSRLLYENEEDRLDPAIGELIELGVDLNAIDYFGDCPLMYAVKSNNSPDLLKKLIAAGADLENRHPKNSATVLGRCLFSSRNIAADRIAILLKSGANINAEDSKGFKPIHIAVGYQNLEGTKLLIQAGADINIASPFRETPLDYAVEQNNQPMIDLLKTHGGKRFSELPK